MKQLTLAAVGLNCTARRRRAVFWPKWTGCAVVGAVRADRALLSEARQWPPAGRVERMLRIYFLQQWFNLSDPAVEGALYDSAAMRRFVGIDPRLREGRLSAASRFPTRPRCAASATCSRRTIWAGRCSTRSRAPGSQAAESGHRHDCRYHDHQCAVPTRVVMARRRRAAAVPLKKPASCPNAVRT